MISFFSVGFMDSMITLFGNLMGENEPDLAMRVFREVFKLCSCIYVLIALLLFVFRYPLVRAMTSDVEV
jgi:Na+-driven multidrug efflux pump